jgi:hypothetical protein
MTFPRALLASLVLSLPIISSAEAASTYKGELSFTEEERAAHILGLSKLTASVTRCLKGELDRHKYFMDRIGISAFYGEQGSFNLKKITGPEGKEITVATSIDEKRAQLRELGIDDSLARQLIPDVACKISEKKCNMLQPTSCIGLTNKCLREGFEEAGQGELWKKLHAYVKANGVAGDALLDGLQKLGWKIYFWAPDASRLPQFDLEERQNYPGNPRGAWGQHVQSYAAVTARSRYFRNTVDDVTSLVNFGATTPDLIRRAPLFVGIAHLGYHVFTGSRGQIVEGHSARPLSDNNTVETDAFNPLAENGGPHGGPYRSGIVALPPSF